jgi:hypothetical protein
MEENTIYFPMCNLIGKVFSRRCPTAAPRELPVVCMHNKTFFISVYRRSRPTFSLFTSK